ncbi:hypothetical protein INR49_009301 [Caranx melampygus]|nr:hypothetical protein INR49_009301 [Caranx melampygus]
MFSPPCGSSRAERKVLRLQREARDGGVFPLSPGTRCVYARDGRSGGHGARGRAVLVRWPGGEIIYRRTNYIHEMRCGDVGAHLYSRMCCADERDRVQKKTFTKWVNKHLMKAQRHITDLYEDLRDGHNLISLLEVLSGETLVSPVDL